jgi:hypothetical protein
MPHHPVAQGWTDIKADIGEIASLSVGSVAFRMDAFVPVWEGRCAGFYGNNTGKGILARGLVEVSVDAKRAQRHIGLSGAKDKPDFTKSSGYIIV